MNESAVHVYTREIVLGVNDSLAKIAALLDPSETMLDVGTGTGAVGRFVQQLGGNAVDGITISTDEQAQAKPHYRRVEICDLDAGAVPKSIGAERYDTIICADVLEHLSRPVAALQKLVALLKPGGRVLVSIPNVTHRSVLLSLLEGRYPRRDEGLLDRTHIQFFDRAGMLELVAQADLHVHAQDAVLRDLVDTEFASVRAEAMPAAVVNFACSGVDSQVYQFIWVLKREAPPEAVAMNKVNALPLPRFQLQAIQFNANGTDLGVAMHAIGEQRQGIQRLRFAGAVTHACKQLRFSLADRAGLLEFVSMRLVNSEEEAVYSWSGSWTPVVQSNACAWSTDRGPFGGTLVRAINADAFVLLDLPKLPDGMLALEIELSCAVQTRDALADPEFARVSEVIAQVQLTLEREREANQIAQQDAYRHINDARNRADRLQLALATAEQLLAQQLTEQSKFQQGALAELDAVRQASSTASEEYAAALRDVLSSLQAEQTARAELERIRYQELADAQAQMRNALGLLEQGRAAHKQELLDVQAALVAEQTARAELERIRNQELLDAQAQIRNAIGLLTSEREAHRAEGLDFQRSLSNLQEIRQLETSRLQEQVDESRQELRAFEARAQENLAVSVAGRSELQETLTRERLLMQQSTDRLAVATAQLAQLEAQLNAVHSSKSWRFTGPLRRMSAWINKNRS